MSQYTTIAAQPKRPATLIKVKLDAQVLAALLERHRRYLRNQSGGARAILRQCDLSGLDLSGGDWTNSEFLVCKFDGANLQRAVFRHANLFGARFNNCDLSSADFEKADLRGAKFELANLTGAHLGGADLREGMVIEAGVTLDGDTGSRFTNAILRGAKLPNAKCRAVDFSGAILEGTDFSDADLRNACFHGAELIDPILRGAQLGEADLRSAVLKGDVGQRLQNSGATLPQQRLRFEAIADRMKQHELWVASQGKEGRRLNLSGCNLEGVDLSGRLMAAARLDHTILVGANLKQANLAAAVLTGANLQGANLVCAELRGADLRWANLRDAVLLGTRQGEMPGLAGLKTLIESEE
ncbi:MAG TPA: pentapeptide repeat-containing protein [Stellaceae bacterium]|nr:pentapeptide repeat-containing protein [Stellaceae bacterium]